MVPISESTQKVRYYVCQYCGFCVFYVSRTICPNCRAPLIVLDKHGKYLPFQTILDKFMKKKGS